MDWNQSNLTPVCSSISALKHKSEHSVERFWHWLHDNRRFCIQTLPDKKLIAATKDTPLKAWVITTRIHRQPVLHQRGAATTLLWKLPPSIPQPFVSAIKEICKCSPVNISEMAIVPFWTHRHSSAVKYEMNTHAGFCHHTRDGRLSHETLFSPRHTLGPCETETLPPWVAPHTINSQSNGWVGLQQDATPGLCPEDKAG